MRCNNCGWENKPGAVKCEKCNFKLESASGGQASLTPPPPSPAGQNDSLGKTIKGNVANYDAWDNSNNPHNNQGPIQTPPMPQPFDHPDIPPAVPPIGQRKVDPQAVKNNPFKGTIDPSRQRLGSDKEITLNLIPKENEEQQPLVVLEGSSIMLNRDVVDPGNYSITSKEQATIEYRDGAWYILDKSELKTTFIQVNKPYKLEKGDIILLGNRKIIFEGD